MRCDDPEAKLPRPVPRPLTGSLAACPNDIKPRGVRVRGCPESGATAASKVGGSSVLSRDGESGGAGRPVQPSLPTSRTPTAATGPAVAAVDWVGNDHNRREAECQLKIDEMLRVKNFTGAAAVQAELEMYRMSRSPIGSA